MAAEKKKSNQNNGLLSVNCDQTYVYNNCSHTLVSAQQDSESDSTAASTMSSDMSPDMSPIRVQMVGCRHQRKGAIREKRSPFQSKMSKSNHYPTDGKPSAEVVATRSMDGKPVEVVNDKSEKAGNEATSDGKPTVIVEDDKGHIIRPFIDFASISEELMMTPIGPSADMLNDGIEEFPAYVPWKATYKWPENSTLEDGVAGPNRQRSEDDDGRLVMCQVCRKCRCMACQQSCKYPKTTVCNVEVSSSNAFIDAMAFMPCVKKTARCIEYVRDYPVAENTWFENPCTKQRYARPPKKWQICGFLFLCFPCFGPYYPLRCVMQCSDQCYGNLNVPGCKCVDWDALRQSSRIRGTGNPYYSALSSSVAERRRRYQNQLTAENAAKAAAIKADAAKAETTKPKVVKSEAVKTEATKSEATKVETTTTNANSVTTITTSSTFRPKPIITRITSNAAIATFADAYRATTAIAATDTVRATTSVTPEITKTAMIANKTTITAKKATKTTKTAMKIAKVAVALTEK